jgi:prepilin-type processing-associated H-X9-DG protein
LPTDSPLNVYIQSVVINNQNLPAGCTYLGTSYSTRITYRGQQFYRSIPSNNYYTHTLTPNFNGYDCGSSNYIQAHIAARSYHPGGVNVAFADGTVRFIKDSINATTWRAVGTKAAGEVISADAF